MMSSSGGVGASGKEYDVFISFRGEDTRSKFTSHLHSALVQENIRTYIDYQLNRGGDVWQSLSAAIESSLIAVVVFSENYSDSKWCLEELVKIMECRKNGGLIVIPVFYEIQPSDVRRQKGSYEKAFAKYVRELDKNESNPEIIVGKWRDALREAANISGWDSLNRIHRDEAHVIHNIVRDISQKLYQLFPNELKSAFGIEKTCEYLEFLLKRVQKIGIWGMSGIGKSTIARALFAKLLPRYDNACFLENIRETRLSSLREKLLFELLKVERVTSQFVGSTFIMERLKGKQICIVLDDVDSDVQLEHLCGLLSDLGGDITLIVTTTNKQLINGRVDKIYEVKEWRYEVSLEFFCLNAFMKKHPEEGCEELSRRAVLYARGFPIALKILASHLRSRPPAFWESMLSKLESMNPDKEIMKVLKQSYDGLEDLQKQIFLDIAFFFNHKGKKDVMSILDACGFYATSGIEVLEDKALITIGYNDEIQMHGLLIEMGMEIVRNEDVKNPERRSRLKGDDAYKVLANSEGTEAVEGILLDLTHREHLHLRADTFKRMSKLRFLQLHASAGEKSCLEYNDTIPITFPNELRYLELDGCPFKSFPPKFCPKFLVEIRMPYSDLKDLWQGKQDLPNLKVVDLRECKQLTELPDFSEESKLQRVYLSGCVSLGAIPQSLLSVNTLSTLLLDGCKKLKSLKTEKHFNFLHEFSVDNCSSLKDFSLSSEVILRLDLSRTGVKILHSTISRLSRLSWLNLESLRLEILPDELSQLKSLTILRISNCEQAISKHKLHVLCNGTLQSLKVLHLKDCSELIELPDNIIALSSLHELRLDGSCVESLPESIKHFQLLEILSFKNCKKLRFLPELPPCIKVLSAQNCTSLETASNLKTFSVQMTGKYKSISFKNATRLSESSLLSIMEDTEHTMLSAAFHNVIVRCFDELPQNRNYNSVRVCFPGRNVPTFFPYQTTESSITVELPSDGTQLLGFIYCVVLSQPRGMRSHKGRIYCECSESNDSLARYRRSVNYQDFKDLSSDHVFVWYDPCHCDGILDNNQRKVGFMFSASKNHQQVGSPVIGCGIRPITSSEFEFHNWLWKFDLDFDSKLKLGLRLNLALDMERGNWRDWNLFFAFERGYAWERGYALDENLKLQLESRRQVILEAIETGNNGIIQMQNQEQRDLIDNENKESSSEDSFTAALRIPPTSHADIAPAKAAQQKRMEAYNQENWDSSPKQFQEQVQVNNNQGDQVMVENQPVADIVPDINKEITEQPRDMDVDILDTTTAPPANTEIPSGYDEITSPKIEALIDEDPLAAIDSLIGKALSKSSTRAQQSSIHEPINTATSASQRLDTLRSAIFSKSLLKKLPTEASLRAQVRAAFEGVQEVWANLTPEQRKGVQDTRALFERCLVTIDKVQSLQAEAQRIEQAKVEWVSKLRETREELSNLQTEIATAEMKEKEIDKEILQLGEKLNKLKEDRNRLKAAREKHSEQRKRCVNNVKNFSRQEAELEAKEQENKSLNNTLNGEYERSKGEYLAFIASPPF